MVRWPLLRSGIAAARRGEPQAQAARGGFDAGLGYLQEVLAKKFCRPRALVWSVTGYFSIGVRRACGLNRRRGIPTLMGEYRDSPAVAGAGPSFGFAATP